MTPRQIHKYCPLRPEAAGLLKAAMEGLGLSARAHDKALRVARTMADLRHPVRLDRTAGGPGGSSTGASQSREATPARPSTSRRFATPIAQQSGPPAIEFARAVFAGPWRPRRKWGQAPRRLGASPHFLTRG